VDPAGILRIWEEQWRERWEPDAAGRERFLDRSEVECLSRLDYETVVEACRNNFKLNDALEWALERLFEMNLDKSQLDAVTSPLANTLVTSRAGSGKTRVLISRALWLQKVVEVSPKELLLLAFNKKAADEMSNRLREHFSEEDELPHVMTFDALAWALVKPQEQILFDDISAGQRQLTNRIAGIQNSNRNLSAIIRKVMSSTSVVRRVLDFLLEPFIQGWKDIEEGRLDLESRDNELLLLHRNPEITVLENDRLVAVNGDYVKSEGERLISNTLFFNDVTAEYERAFEFGETVYKPDFTIQHGNEGGVIIEYFGLHSIPEYAEQMQSKRQYWREQPNWELIEIFPYDIASRGEEEFTRYLLGILKNFGVSSRRLTEQEVFQRLPKSVQIDKYTKVLTSFVTRCRAKKLSPSDLRRRISVYEPTDEHEEIFLSMAEVVYKAYLDDVVGDEFDDFKGLMWRAVSLVEDGQVRFTRDRDREVGDLGIIKHILIDEFQDFSEIFYALIDAIRSSNPNVRIFAVGDDWQAINGFAGSDLNFFINFDDFFENTNHYTLTNNYRSSPAIVDVSNSVMASVDHGAPVGVAVNDFRSKVRVWKLSGLELSNSEMNNHNGGKFIAAVIRLVNDHLEYGRNVVMLSRTNTINSVPLDIFLEEVRSCISLVDHQKVSISTSHQFKGLEEQGVIILDANARRYPLVHPEWKYQRIFGDSEFDITSEERRLFYVALSRAKISLDVVINDIEYQEESPFLDSLTHLARESFVYGSWNYLRAVPVGAVTVLVSGRTFDVKEILREEGYIWNDNERVWQKKFSGTEFEDYSLLESEAWFTSGVKIRVLDPGGTLIYESGSTS